MLVIPRKETAHGSARVCVAGVGRDGLFVALDRLVAAAEALAGLAGYHVAHRRVCARFVRLLDGLAVQGRGRLIVAPKLRPLSADQQEHGEQGRHLP